jgi:arsenical pump membrane protein
MLRGMSDRGPGYRGPGQPPARSRHRLPWLFAAVGGAGAVIAALSSPADARSASAQAWSPFVLVSGLLLIGLVADDDGLFASAGHRLARTSRNGLALFLGASVLIGVTTALLNLDTSVAFLTPVLVYTARSRSESEAPLLCASVLLANAGSLFLPGSNLTNLIVLGHLRITGAAFFAHMWLPALTALVVTAAVIALSHRRALRVTAEAREPAVSPVVGLGLVAVVVATALVVALRSPALPVLGVGIVVITARLAQRREQPRRVIDTLGVPVLVGLFGLAVALGTLGRTWSGPATLLNHLDTWGTATFAALSSVVVNNLPAASLLAARRPSHPFSLLIGLNLGPNLFVTGSLAWILWLRAARGVGAEPSIRSASRIGLVAVPVALAAAVGVLVLSGAS